MFAVCLCCAALAGGAAVAGQQAYDLSARPRFAAGDLVTRTASRTGRTSYVDDDGQSAYETAATIQSTEEHVVLITDAAGQVRSFRDHVVSAEMTCSLKRKGEEQASRGFSLDDVACLVSWQKRHFSPDTTTVFSRTHHALSAPQVTMMKRLFHDNMRFGGYGQTGPALMPEGTVTIGQKWLPASGAVAGWVGDALRANGLEVAKPEGSVELVGVDNGVAELRGSAAFELTFVGAPARGRATAGLKVDTATGRLLQEDTSIHLIARSGDRMYSVEVETTCRTAFQAGGGKAMMDLPAGGYDLGWRPPGKDKNRYSSQADGVSLAVPREFKRKADDDGGGTIFSSGHGSTVRLQVQRPVLLAELDVLAAEATRQLAASVSQYATTSDEPVILPGNVPARLLKGRGRGGEVVILALLACDDMRLVTVSAAAPVRSSRDVAEVERIVRSLRVSRPEAMPAE